VEIREAGCHPPAARGDPLIAEDGRTWMREVRSHSPDWLRMGDARRLSLGGHWHRCAGSPVCLREAWVEAPCPDC